MACVYTFPSSRKNLATNSRRAYTTENIHDNENRFTRLFLILKMDFYFLGCSQLRTFIFQIVDFYLSGAVDFYFHRVPEVFYLQTRLLFSRLLTAADFYFSNCGLLFVRSCGLLFSSRSGGFFIFKLDFYFLGCSQLRTFIFQIVDFYLPEAVDFYFHRVPEVFYLQSGL